MKNKAIATLVGICALGIAVSGCSTISPPDGVGLYYMEGPSDGYKFGRCIDPGQTGPPEWNNSVVYLPTNLRTWTMDDTPDPQHPGQFVKTQGADSGDVTVVSAKPQEGQPSGIQVKVATKTSFLLNTYCDKNGGVAREWWEKIGRRYGADTPNGWVDMLNAVLVPTLKTIIRDVVRGYNADPLIANENGVQAEVQRQVSERLATEFNRTAGGNFFCGPTFNRAKPDCPSLELLVIDIDFADAGLRAARNEKQKNLELAAAQLAKAQGEAAALVAEATGKANAARELATLYNNPGWVALQKQITAGNALIEACKVAKECRLIVGSDGNLIMQ